MKKILLSVAMILFVGGALALGGTGAFFSDTETSSGNTFTAGAIDLKIDNSSYYNGVATSTTSWSLVDLTIEKFFNFFDLKPGDYGEDTISLHVDTNDAYLCANITLTSNNDNTCNEPELDDEPNCQAPGVGEGELAQNVNFMWWADDGDNVLESEENVISSGPIGALTLGAPYPIALADSDENIWTGVGGPVPGTETKYIGKAWCFGNIAPLAVPQDGVGNVKTPAGDNDGNQIPGQPTDGGYSCNGSALNNNTQTDSLTADVTFTAVQSRNNTQFQCEEGHCPIVAQTILLPGSGFELPEVTNGAQWDVFPSPSGPWNVEWRDAGTNSFGSQIRPVVANLELHEGVLGPAFEGDQYAELDTDWGGPNDSGTGEPASVRIYQDIPTVVGKNYEIHYKFSPRPNTPASENSLEVGWGGNVVETIPPTAGGGAIAWTEHVVNVVATTTTTRIWFTDLGTSNSLGTFVDDIRVYTENCTPIN